MKRPHQTVAGEVLLFHCPIAVGRNSSSHYKTLQQLKMVYTVSMAVAHHPRALHLLSTDVQKGARCLFVTNQSVGPGPTETKHQLAKSNCEAPDVKITTARDPKRCGGGCAH